MESDRMNFFKKLFGKKEKQVVQDVQPVVKTPSLYNKMNMVNAKFTPEERLEMLIEYAQENDMAIVVGKQDRADFIKLMDDSIKILRLADGFTLEVKAVDFEEVLVDETVSREMYKWLKEQTNIDVHGGFIGEE